VKRDEESGKSSLLRGLGSYEKGYYGLPTALEVSQDLIVQMPDPSMEMLQAMEVEQYFFAEENDEEGLINGHHINIYLKDSFIESCKTTPRFYS